MKAVESKGGQDIQEELELGGGRREENHCLRLGRGRENGGRKEWQQKIMDLWHF